MQWTVPAYVEILQNHSDEYYSCGKGKRGALVNSVAKEIISSSKEHRSPLPDDLPHVRVSCVILVMLAILTGIKKIINWFNNHRKTSADKEDVEDSDKRILTTWTVRKIVKELMEDEIDAVIKQRDPNCRAGTKDYIKLYQRAWTEVEKGLSEEKRREYENLAEEWNREGTTLAVKARLVISLVALYQGLIRFQPGRKQVFRPHDQIYENCV